MKWLALLGALLVSAVHGETLVYQRFGTLTLYHGARAPHEVVLFFSGDGGWNLGVVNMAQQLEQQGALVVGIDIRHYLAALESAPEACVSPADDLENLSQFVQTTLGVEPRVVPLLAGYSSGATLVYAALVQGPAGRFKGALSLGFCPDLELKKPLCAGGGIGSSPRHDSHGNLTGVNFLPARSLPGPWIALQGALDQVCPAVPTQQFLTAVPGADLVLLPKVGHGYGVAKNWVPQFESAFRQLSNASAAQAH